MDVRFDFLWALGAAVIAFALSAIFGRVLIPYLHKLKFGQTILEIGPKWHQKKQGTPTMGGIMFIIGIAVATIGVLTVHMFVSGDPFAFARNAGTFIGLGMAICYGIVGFIDDYIKVVKKRNLGLSASQKLVLQLHIFCGDSVLLFLARDNLIIMEGSLRKEKDCPDCSQNQYSKKDQDPSGPVSSVSLQPPAVCVVTVIVCHI